MNQKIIDNFSKLVIIIDPLLAHGVVVVLLVVLKIFHSNKQRARQSRILQNLKNDDAKNLVIGAIFKALLHKSVYFLNTKEKSKDPNTLMANS